MTLNTPNFDSRTSRTGTFRMQGRVLWGLRAAWGALALLTLGLFLYGIPNQLQILLQSPEFAPEILQQVGISPQVVAWYDLSLDLLQTGIFFFMAVLLFVRRSDDRMAVLTSLMLIMWGSTTLTSIITGLTITHPDIALPINLIKALG